MLLDDRLCLEGVCVYKFIEILNVFVRYNIGVDKPYRVLIVPIWHSIYYFGSEVNLYSCQITSKNIA